MKDGVVLGNASEKRREVLEEDVRFFLISILRKCDEMRESAPQR